MEEPPLGSEWREKRERAGIGTRARGLAEGATALQLGSEELLGSEQRGKREGGVVDPWTGGLAEEGAQPGLEELGSEQREKREGVAIGPGTCGGAERGLLGSEARGSKWHEPPTGKEGPAGGDE